jgi:hypothetical protein
MVRKTLTGRCTGASAISARAAAEAGAVAATELSLQPARIGAFAIALVAVGTALVAVMVAQTGGRQGRREARRSQFRTHEGSVRRP